MKKSIFLLGLVAMMALSCTEDKDAPMITLTSQNELTVPAEGGTLSLEFNSNVAWTASVSDKDFVTISPASGEAGDNAIKVTFLKNENPDPRTTNVTVVGETASATVKITQLQKNALVAPEGVIEIGCNEWDSVITVSSNADFKVEASVDWITVAPITKGMVDSQVGIHVALNKGDEARTGTISFTGEGFKQEITIKQGAFEPMLYIDYDFYEFDQKGGTLTFTVMANVAYEFIAPECDWATWTNEGDTYTVTAEPNISWQDRYVDFMVQSEEFTILDDLDWDGVPETEVPAYAAVEFVQYGLEDWAWGYYLPEWLVDAPNPAELKNEYSYAVTGNVMFISTGVSTYALYTDLSGSAKINTDYTVTSLAADDAGNIVVEIGGAWNEPIELRAYTAQNFLSGGEYTTLYEGVNGIYGFGLTNLNVTGDVFKDAVVNLVSAGMANEETGETDNYTYAFQIKGGEVADYIIMQVPAGTTIWRSPDLVTKFTTTDINGGVFYMGYDAHYDLCYNPGTEFSGWKHVIEGIGSWAEGYNAMEQIEFNGHKYLAFVGQCFFPCWGMPSYLWLVNVDDPENPEPVSVQEYYGPGCDLTGIYSNVALDLQVEKEGLCAYVIDGEQGVFFKCVFPAY